MKKLFLISTLTLMGLSLIGCGNNSGGDTPSPDPADPVLTSLTYTGTLEKSTYTEGDTFSAAGLTVTANYDVGDPVDVTSKVTWPTTPLTVDITQVTGSYTEKDVTKTVTVTGITVNEKIIDAYKVSFNITGDVKVYVYAYQDYTLTPVESSFAYSVDSETGDYLKDGSGQINFKIVAPDNSYCFLDADDLVYDGEMPYKNLKYIGGGIYRITKITDNFSINFAAESGDPDAYEVTFIGSTHATVKVFASKDAEIPEGISNGEVVTVYSRDGDTGSYLKDDSQIHFTIETDDGYYTNIGNSDICGEISGEGGGFKNLKCLDEGYYRITKISENLTINVCDMDAAPKSCNVTFVIDEGIKVKYFISEAALEDDNGKKDLTSIVARDGTNGQILEEGGKVIFLVENTTVYTVIVSAEGSFKNCKLYDEENYPNVYNVTKIASDITIYISLT